MSFKNPPGQNKTLTVGATAAGAVGSKVTWISIVPAAADAVLTFTKDDGSGAVLRVIMVKASQSSKDLDDMNFGRPSGGVTYATLTGAGAVAYIGYDD